MILKKEFYIVELNEKNLKIAKQYFTIKNKELEKKKRLGLPIYNIKKTINLYKVENGKILIPSGIEKEEIKKYFNENTIFDGTSLGTKNIINLHFIKKDVKKLFDYQEKSLNEILEKINKERKLNFGLNGIIQAPTGSGKTYLTMHLINKLDLKVLWFANKKILLEQAKKTYKETFNYNDLDIGEIESGKETIGNKITFATFQSVAKKDKKFIEKIKNEFGLIIVDEAHNVVGTENQINTFTNALNSFNASYKIGLTATPNFENEKVLRMFLGKNLTEIKSSESKILPIKTNFIINEKEYDFFDYTDTDGTIIFQKLTKMIGLDENRIQLITNKIEELLKQNRKILVACKYVEEVYKYTDFLKKIGLKENEDFIQIVGKTTKKLRDELLEKDYKVLVATNSLLGEGFDAPKLDTLIITNCIRSEKNLIQLLGRVRRKNENKTNSYCYIINDVNLRPRYSDIKKIKKVIEKENKSLDNVKK